MRLLQYSVNVTLDGCCDHREMFADEESHRHSEPGSHGPWEFLPLSAVTSRPFDQPVTFTSKVLLDLDPHQDRGE